MNTKNITIKKKNSNYVEKCEIRIMNGLFPNCEDIKILIRVMTQKSENSIDSIFCRLRSHTILSE